MLRQIEEKGLRLIVNLHEVAHGEKGVDVFSGNYGCTTKFDVIALNDQLGSEIWIVDSSTNQHCYNDLALFSIYEIHPLNIGIGTIVFPGRGSVKLSIAQSSRQHVYI